MQTQAGHHQDKRFQDLYISSAQTKNKSSVSPEQMKKADGRSEKTMIFVLLDCPAGIEQGFQNAIAGADKAIVVTTPGNHRGDKDHQAWRPPVSGSTSL